MCWDVCNLTHAAFPPREHTQPHQPRHTVTHSDTRWRPAPGARPSLGDAPAIHTPPPLRSHPHSGRSHAPAALPRAGPRRFCSVPFQRRDRSGRAGMSSRRRPPASQPNSLQMPAARPAARPSGAPCRTRRAAGGRGAGGAPPAGRGGPQAPSTRSPRPGPQPQFPRARPAARVRSRWGRPERGLCRLPPRAFRVTGPRPLLPGRPAFLCRVPPRPPSRLPLPKLRGAPSPSRVPQGARTLGQVGAAAQASRPRPRPGPAHSCSSRNKHPSFYWESSRGLTTAWF